MDARQAIKDAQRLLNRPDQPVTADGLWGGYTNRAYIDAPTSTRLQVDAILNSVSANPEQLYQAYRSAKAVRSPELAAAKLAAKRAMESRSIDVLTQAAKEVGVPAGQLIGMARIESGLNPTRSQGSSRGLLAMQPGAWADASQYVRLKPYSNESVFDPLENARAGAGYQKALAAQLRSAGYSGPQSPAVLYLAHQQGAVGFTKMWKAAQGDLAAAAAVSKSNMERNPPQDGRGSTTDPAEFYRRWMAVADRKIKAAS